MKRIGFTNFRKFENFPAIEFSPITFLVGENNAGKSTVVKGILAVSDFLNKLDTDRVLLMDDCSSGSQNEIRNAIILRLKDEKFYFNMSYLTHIGTFKRALFNKAKNNVIRFYTTIGYEDIVIEVNGNKEDEEIVYGIISKITLDYKMIGLHIVFDLQNNNATVSFKPVEVKEQDLTYLPIKKRGAAVKFLKAIPHEYEVSYSISDYYRRSFLDLLYLLQASVEIALSATMEPEKTNKFIGSRVMLDVNPVANVDTETVDFLKQFTKIVCFGYGDDDWIFFLPDSDLHPRIEYIYAHAVTQTVLYGAKETNDYLSMTIHEFASNTKSNDVNRRKFITDWMKEFKIGQDYTIKSVGGEAHIVKIKNDNGEYVNLADKGMGSIQLMVLLFRLAITLPIRPIIKSKSTISSVQRTIIIEEPEQNLHPMLQSKLADLFLEMYESYGFRFIIETHSEYLIRKTQALVGSSYRENNDFENPFKVYYFPANGIPYDMPYAKTGRFEEQFGSGFFDEATKWNREVLRNENAK